MISFDGVSKSYPDGTLAVDDLSLDVPEGTLTVFVGPSGCGKTTSMRMINRMVDPTSGTVSVDGRDVREVNPVKLRLGIGYVIQSGGLMPHQRVIDNVATVPVLTGVSRRQARQDAYEVLERVGLDAKLAERYPAQLSGGQQQRVGVARALAADPPILLMDEPFSAVDPVVREELQAEILRLQSELHKTIVFVTHDIDEAVKLGDSVAVFGAGGTLQQYDTPARLLSNPANDFVAGFIGTDRGYRLLQFFTASDLELRALSTVTEDEVDGLVLAPDEWRLVLKPDGSPFGWIDAAGVERHHRGSSLYDSVTAGGSLFRPGGTLRSALDSALSSPSGIGVAVDDRGAAVGGTDADEVVAALDMQRQAAAAKVPEVPEVAKIPEVSKVPESDGEADEPAQPVPTDSGFVMVESAEPVTADQTAAVLHVESSESPEPESSESPESPESSESPEPESSEPAEPPEADQATPPETD